MRNEAHQPLQELHLFVVLHNRPGMVSQYYHFNPVNPLDFSCAKVVERGIPFRRNMASNLVELYR